MEGSSELGSSVDRVIWALRGWCSCSLVRLSDHQTSEFQVVGDGFHGAFGCSSVPGSDPLLICDDRGVSDWEVRVSDVIRDVASAEVYVDW
jgi:hypothetical protein